MEVFVLCQRLSNVPTQPIDIDPSTFHPVLLGFFKELDEGCIVQLIQFDLCLAIIHNRYLAFLLEYGHRCVYTPAIGFRGVESRLLSSMPIRLEIVGIDSAEGVA